MSYLFFVILLLMGRGADIPGPKASVRKAEAKAKKKRKAKEKLWYSPDEITLTLEIPEDYINMEGSVAVDEKTVRLHHADGPDGKIHLSHSLGGSGSSSCDHNAPESMPANSSVPVKITASIDYSGMIQLNAEIQGTPPGGAVGAMLFYPGSEIREESFYIWTRGPRMLQANLDIKVKIVAKSLKTVAEVLGKCRRCKKGYPLSAFRDPKGSPTAVYTDAGAVCLDCWHEINDKSKNPPKGPAGNLQDILEKFTNELSKEERERWLQKFRDLEKSKKGRLSDFLKDNKIEGNKIKDSHFAEVLDKKKPDSDKD